MAYSLHLTHICGKGFSWRDVDFVYSNAVHNHTATLFLTDVAFFCEISRTVVLMKLLLAFEVHVTTAAFSPSLPARGQESSRRSTLPLISRGVGVALKLPWSIYSGIWG